MTLAAITAGDEEADFERTRERLNALLTEPLPRMFAGRDLEESELRLAVGLSA